MRALVFGRTGQVGSSLEKHLGSLDGIRFLDREQADLAQPACVSEAIDAMRPDLVINAAAYTAVDRAEDEPELAMCINAQAPAAMAQACARIGAWLIHYSTDYVFDGTANEPWTEEIAPAPINVYGRSKLAGEQAIRTAHDRHLIFRLSWVYSNHGRNFLNTILRLALVRDELNIVADQIGAPTYAGAIAEATEGIVRDLISGTAGEGDDAGTYHMSCAGRASWYDFTRRVLDYAGTPRKVRVNPIDTSEYPTRATRPRFSVLSNDKLERAFGVRLEPWPDALSRCLRERDQQ